MTPCPALVLLAAGVAVIVAGVAALLVFTVRYIGNPHAVSSTSGDRVYRLNGELVAYSPFSTGLEPVAIGLGVVIALAAVVIAAATWRVPQPS
jgi:hypothetical protein